jgi:hypothetical protein
MPLYANGRALVRANLETIQNGKKARLVAIGQLTNSQLAAINGERVRCGYPPIDAEVVFLGQHAFNSRIRDDGYSVEDVVEQIANALDAGSIARESFRGTTVENTNQRDDGYGNLVLDRAVLECTARHPRPELFSVIPKGDRNKPKKKPLVKDERPETQRLARVTVASGAPVAAENSMQPSDRTSQYIIGLLLTFRRICFIIRSLRGGRGDRTPMPGKTFAVYRTASSTS